MKAVKIKWDTDGDKKLLKTLPKESKMPKKLTSGEIDCNKTGKTFWLVIYRDTIEEHFEGNNNLSEIEVSSGFIYKFFKEKIEGNSYSSFKEFIKNYTADDTLELYQFAKEHDAVLNICHW